jgi:hypothetical protein
VNRVTEKKAETEDTAFVTLPRALSPFMKSFAKKIDPENVMKEIFLGKKKEDPLLNFREVDKDSDPDQGGEGQKIESSAPSILMPPSTDRIRNLAEPKVFPL